MGVPISIRLDEDVRDELDEQARAQGIGLATLLRDLAVRAARGSRHRRIREASERVASQISISAEARSFYEDWGTPHANAG